MQIKNSNFIMLKDMIKRKIFWRNEDYVSDYFAGKMYWNVADIHK